MEAEVTAPTPEKIQRYRLDFQTMEAHNSTRMLPQSDGQLILYGDYMKAMKKKNADHLRHLKLAQIEALESITYLFKHSDGIEELEAKIAALRKEIEG